MDQKPPIAARIASLPTAGGLFPNTTAASSLCRSTNGSRRMASTSA
jgi:hypothetical protein